MNLEPSMETALETVNESAKALTKFQEILLKFFGPRWTRIQADADAYSDERKLQTIRNNPDMEITYIDGKINARSRFPEELAERARLRAQTEEIKQQQNIEKVIELAVDEIQHAETVSDDAVCDDWITRFINITKDISSEELQYIWAKILSGEIVRPGSFSLRTLETIRNISKQEAAIFQKIAPLVMSDGAYSFIPMPGNLLKKYDITLTDIMIMSECGFVNSTGIFLTPTLQDDKIAQYYNNTRYISIINRNNAPQKLSIGVYTLTKVGIELLNILNIPPIESYCLDFASEIKESHKQSNIEVSVHKVNYQENGIINYDIQPLALF